MDIPYTIFGPICAESIVKSQPVDQFPTSGLLLWMWTLIVNLYSTESWSISTALNPASEMTHIVSGGALNSTHSQTAPSVFNNAQIIPF